ncbi:phosphonate ABC transporter substrate-binding protein [Tardiphaga robiniae]|uniref:Phosphonate ABC transporter substrate-binding protein n=1 Tax=Tardiphaga robiniae TaxID=943830 RepID=A0A161QYS2_9BRAD|nr:phosphonate ABC transporter substrate-binding protein [Tardiphaga robiniae]KZD21221.1 phosphonate ABC transporter substrate-binding protein [Tardiphaga robiniae]
MNMRLALSAVSIGACLATFPAMAESWKDKYPEIVLAMVPNENATGKNDRVTSFADYLSKELGVKVVLRIANDYTAVIEGQKNKQIHIGLYGPGSYARANTVSGGNVIPFVTTRNADQSIGYYSVMYVRADSPYKTVEDLKGKVLGTVDVESTSGFKAPNYFLTEQGFPIDKHFKLVQTTGSHENAVLALASGTVDAAVNWWNSDDDSNLTRMLNKGMVKKLDGSPMKKEDFRLLWKSPLLPGPPYAYLADMPDDMKKAIAKAFLDAPTKDKEAFSKLSDGKDIEFVPVTTKDYEESVKMNLWLDAQRKKKT